MYDVSHSPHIVSDLAQKAISTADIPENRVEKERTHVTSITCIVNEADGLYVTAKLETRIDNPMDDDFVDTRIQWAERRMRVAEFMMIEGAKKAFERYQSLLYIAQKSPISQGT
jgi:hypothetical protein